MKKLYNDKARMVDDMIDGYVAAFPSIVSRGRHPRVVRRKKLRTHDEKVAILIGNGSGHEPIAMGFVGEGLLDANIVGDVFTAPSPDLILEGLEEVVGSPGAILLISRHEGDVINGNAAALMAQDDGLDVRPLLMYDDVSSAPKGSEDERRGAAGTLFIYKILGAASEANLSIDELLALGEDVRGRTRTLGAAVAPGISPVTGELCSTYPTMISLSAWAYMASPVLLDAKWGRFVILCPSCWARYSLIDPLSRVPKPLFLSKGRAAQR